jgi:predicted component of type VI protein secretion system
MSLFNNKIEVNGGNMVYISPEDDWDELYNFRKKELKELEKSQRLPKSIEEESVRVIEKEKIVPRTRNIHILEDEEITSLKRSTPKIIGSLFDRVGFLKERIKETTEIMKTREQLHKQIVSEIDADIQEKMDMESHIADFDEKRNLRLDISVLRREKRRENIQFWKDMVELRTELKQLMEEYQIESKISGIFKELKGEEHG